MLQPTPPSVISYHLNDKAVYVTTAANFEQAIDYAKEVFSEELHNVPRDRISFSIVSEESNRHVEVSAMAWQSVIHTLEKYSIVHVHVKPESLPPKYVDAIAADAQVDAKNGPRTVGRPATCRWSLSRWKNPFRH